jgi:competence protein ComEA
MLVTTKKILLISASLIALSGSASVLAASDQQRSSLASQQVQQQVNINNASAVEIAVTLKGVGLKTANAIVAYRKANGAFKSVESIAMVKGVGSKTLAKNSARIVLE